jgi:glycerophosphoryl diester phosphodiesterase
MSALLALLVIELFASPGGATPVLLPAYSHNDYQNDRPLTRALELGFRGVEVDYFLVDGELRVGHDPGETRPGRTVESLYLEPLRDRVRRYGEVYPGGGEFYLNIESKREGMETYAALHELLSHYEDVVTVVRGEAVDPGPVQVILVGWHPPLDDLWRQPVRYVAVQAHYRSLAVDHDRYPSHLLKLISQNYNDKILSRGGEPVSRRMRCRLKNAVNAARMVPGRIVRVYNVPSNAATYEALLEAEIDLIGTKDIEGASRLFSKLFSE